MNPIRLTTTTLQVLEVLAGRSGEVYGLEIATATGLMTGTIYPILARLERAGWVEGRWDTSDDRGPRKRYYRLTPPARQETEEILAARAKEHEEALARAARRRAQQQTS